MDAAGVMSWVTAYERAWRNRDLDAVERLFTLEASYRPSPYEPPKLGHDAIKEFWPEDENVTFTMEARPLAVEGDVAVVRLTVVYLTPEHQEYTDLWVLRFAEDERVSDFEEWAYWPGKSYSAAEA